MSLCPAGRRRMRSAVHDRPPCHACYFLSLLCLLTSSSPYGQGPLEPVERTCLILTEYSFSFFRGPAWATNGTGKDRTLDFCLIRSRLGDSILACFFVPLATPQAGSERPGFGGFNALTSASSVAVLPSAESRPAGFFAATTIVGELIVA